MNKLMSHKIFSNDKVRQATILYLSSLISVLLGVGTSVLNTSFLTPEYYGDVRYINNIISFIGSLLLLGFFTSGCRLLALSKNEQNSKRIKGAMIVILIITIFVMSLAMIICYYIHLRYLNYQVASLFLIAIPICSAPLLQNYANTVFQGDNSIIKLSLGRILPSFIYLFLAYYIYKNFQASSQLMLLLQNGCIVFVFVILIILTTPSFRNLKTSFNELKKENKIYGFYVYIGSVVGVSLNYLAGITLGVFGENNVNVGIFTLAATLVTPLAMLPTVVGTTYYKKFANQNFIEKKVLITTLIISFISLLLFAIFITPIVSVLYNESYIDVARIAIYLAVGTTLHGIGDLFNRFLGSHGLGKQLRNGAFVCGGVMLVGYIILVYYCGITGAIITKIGASSAYCFSMVYYYKRYRISVKDI